jgi:hypothetical protein
MTPVFAARGNPGLPWGDLRAGIAAHQLAEADMTGPTVAEAQDWLEKDEAKSRPHRAERLTMLLTTLPIPEDGLLMFGGMGSAQAFTEIRLAYIHGLYLSTVLLALACIELELAGALYAAGIDRAVKARLEWLLAQSRARGIITDQEFKTFDHLRTIRNSYTHYRAIADSAAWERRAMTTDTPIHEILEVDAEDALAALGSYMARK